MKLSYIIPLYNKEKYIERCITSIHNNEIDYEIIVIDDGSTDNSYELVEKIATCNKHLKLIKKNNTGVSATRNVGLNIAEGEYVQFIDADDYITENMSELMIRIAETENADIVCCTYSEKEIISNDAKANRIINIFDNFDELYEKKIFHNIGTKVYKKKILEGIYFNEKISLYEDISFCLKALAKSRKSIYVDSKFYIYTIEDSDSLSRKFCKNYKESMEYLFETYDYFSKIKNKEFSCFKKSKKGILHRYLEGESKKTLKEFKISCEISEKYMRDERFEKDDYLELFIIIFLLKTRMWNVLYIYFKIIKGVKNR